MKKSMKLHAIALAAISLSGAQHAYATYINDGLLDNNGNLTVLANNDNNGAGEGLTLKSNAAGAAGATFITNGNTTIWGNSSTTVQSNANVSIVGNNDNTGGGEGVRILSQGNADNNNGAYINVQDTTIKLQSGTGAINLTSTSNVIKSTDTGAMSNLIWASNGGGNTLAADTGDNTIRTGTGNNVITAGSGGAGSNVITANGGDNTMTTATGKNTLSAVANKLTATSNFGTNTISAMGTSGANTMEAEVANTITSNGDNNMLAVSGANNLTAGANNITATGANTISGASNSMTATSGGNTMAAVNGTNTISGKANVMTSTTTNTISATTANTITALTNTISGVTNSMGNLTAASTNAIGTGTQKSTNAIGNTNAATTVVSVAGNASQALANDTAATTVQGGVSALTARTDADGNPVANATTTAEVLLTNAQGASVDANGKLTARNAEQASPTAALTLTNGYGNTHGIVVTESQTTISGGTQSSSMTLADNGATFSNAETGAPVQVHGVADGTADFDAINVRQFAGAIAAVTAQANIPSLAAGQDKTIGVGLGHFMGKTGLAVGMNLRGKKNGIYKLSVSTGLNGGAKFVVGGGAAWSF